MGQLWTEVMVKTGHDDGSGMSTGRSLMTGPGATCDGECRHDETGVRACTYSVHVPASATESLSSGCGTYYNQRGAISAA